MANTYSSISELVNDSCASEEFKEATQQHFSKRKVVKNLVAIRVALDLSQEDIAREIGCSQIRIVKLENGTDDDIGRVEFRNYLLVLLSTLNRRLADVERRLDAMDEHERERKERG